MTYEGEKGKLGEHKSTHRVISLGGLVPKISYTQQEENGYIYSEENSQHQLRNVPEEGFLHLFRSSTHGSKHSARYLPGNAAVSWRHKITH